MLTRAKSYNIALAVLLAKRKEAITNARIPALYLDYVLQKKNTTSSLSVRRNACRLSDLLLATEVENFVGLSSNSGKLALMNVDYNVTRLC